MKYMKINTLALAAGILLTPFMAAADGNEKFGETRFKNCLTCHSLEKNKHKFGPSLFNVVGRKAGSEKTYRYSEAYLTANKMGLVWTAKNLANYLRDPGEFLATFLSVDAVRPKMMTRLSNDHVREDIVAYLKTLTQ